MFSRLVKRKHQRNNIGEKKLQKNQRKAKQSFKKLRQQTSRRQLITYVRARIPHWSKIQKKVQFREAALFATKV